MHGFSKHEFPPTNAAIAVSVGVFDVEELCFRFRFRYVENILDEETFSADSMLA